MARAFDLDVLALGPRLVPTLEIRIDDLVAARDDAPTRLRLARGRR